MLSLSILGNTIFAQLAFVCLHFNFLKSAHFFWTFHLFQQEVMINPRRATTSIWFIQVHNWTLCPKTKVGKMEDVFFPTASWQLQMTMIQGVLMATWRSCLAAIIWMRFIVRCWGCRWEEKLAAVDYNDCLFRSIYGYKFIVMYFFTHAYIIIYRC